MIQIGIKQTPVKGAQPKVEVFYCGSDGAALRAAHTKLMVKNEDAKFFSIANPLLVPLQNVVHDTTDHPDQIAAHKRRMELAEAAKPKAAQIELTGAKTA
jgi:hypothetical protein